MSFKRGPKPARPPPPKGGLSLGGMSFKKLEQEEEGEDLTISDKYASVVQQARSQTAHSAHHAGKAELSRADADVSAGDEERSSPLKKSVFEYKEILTGLKDKIHGKITKTIEDISGESSASASPDKEHPLAGPLSKSADRLLESLAQEECAPRSSLTRNSSTEPTFLSVKSNSSAELLTRSSLKHNSSSEQELKHSAKSSVSSDSVNSVKPPDPSKAAGAAEERSAGCAEKPPSTLAVQLSSLSNGEKEEENILVFEEHFKEPVEESSGGPTGLVTSTKARPRSKLQSLKKKPLKTSATVSMSGLMRSPDEESAGVQSKSGLNSGTGESPHTQNGADIKRQHAGMLQRLTSHDTSMLPWHKLLAIISCVFAYLIVPLPPFLSGLIAGAVVTVFVWTVYSFLMQPPKPVEPMVLTPIEDLPPMQIPEMKEPTTEDGTYKGWMNEITQYNPDDYHINHTYSVFVTLEGTRLRLQRPKTPVPKRAMHDENIPTPHFIHQRHFELKGSRVFLQPPGLVKKRVWSKKYPICLALAEEGTKSRNSLEPADAAGTSLPTDGKSDFGFEIVSEERCDSSVLFLFARTAREKEEWFKRFEAATLDRPLGNHIMEMRRAIEKKRQHQHRRVGSDSSLRQRHNSGDSQSSTASDGTEMVETESPDSLLDFTQYMGHLMPAGAFSRLLSPAHATKPNGRDGEKAPRLPFTGSIICDSQLYWLNALIGRCFFDFLRDTWWAEKVKDKLQRKLSKIHVPYFIEELQVTAINMGKEMPVIRRAANPYLDERGFWVELDVSYGGSFQMTIETKVNLMKLKRSGEKQHHTPVGQTSSENRSPVTDSDEEDSAESSTDEEEEVAASPEERESGSKKLLKYLDKLTQSRYFQQATEYKYIKRAMENVSNTPLQLAVQLKSLVGKLAVNVPPPPTDRLWYGFRGSPRLWLTAKPQVGERVVTITHITEWIERKLELEFQRVFVMPNMDDLIIPILRAGEGSGEASGEARSSTSSQ